MNRFRFFLCLCGIFVVGLLLNTYADAYISSPFSRVDVIALLITLPILVVLLYFAVKLFQHFKGGKRNKFFLSIAAFAFAVVIITFTDMIWFEAYGRSLFR